MIPVIDREKTGENLRRLITERNLTVKDVQEYMGLGSVQSVYHWLNGISMPTIDNLYALSELLQVPIDALVCGNRSWQLPRISVDCYCDGSLIERQNGRLMAYYKGINKLVS